jgi:hypothetical protein
MPDPHIPSDICDAALTQLRNSPCAALFGDTYQSGVSPPGVMKFFADWSGDSDIPWLVVEEVGETYEYMTRGQLGQSPYIATGQSMVSIFHSSRSQARALGVAVASALDDANAVWPGFPNLMLFRLNMAKFVPITEVGPGGAATIFQRVLIFDHQYSGYLPGGFS